MAKTWKQPTCPSTDERIKTMWYIYTMEGYSAVSNKMDGPRCYHTKWGKSDRKANVSAYIWNLKNDTNELIYIIETDSQTNLWLPKWKGGKG